MQTPLQITMRDVKTSAMLEKRIREKVSKLEKVYTRLLGCDVTVERVQRRQHQGQLFNVHILLSVPGGSIAVSRNEHESIYIALRDTFDAVRRKLADYANKQQDRSHNADSLPSRDPTNHLEPG
jgi:ribosomal subunit interface protein